MFEELGLSGGVKVKDWSLKNLQPQSIEIQLDFTNSDVVSPTLDDQDLLDFKILKPEQFIGASSGLPL